MDYYNKYLKYKTKYIYLKTIFGGNNETVAQENKLIQVDDTSSRRATDHLQRATAYATQRDAVKATIPSENGITHITTSFDTSPRRATGHLPRATAYAIQEDAVKATIPSENGITHITTSVDSTKKEITPQPIDVKVFPHIPLEELKEKQIYKQISDEILAQLPAHTNYSHDKKIKDPYIFNTTDDTTYTTNDTTDDRDAKVNMLFGPPKPFVDFYIELPSFQKS
jgi:hypothetical protein